MEWWRLVPGDSWVREGNGPANQGSLGRTQLGHDECVMIDPGDDLDACLDIRLDGCKVLQHVHRKEISLQRDNQAICQKI